MSKSKKSKSSEPLTPEQVILNRIHHLADLEDVKSFFTKLIMMAALIFVLFGILFGVSPMKNNDMMPRISSGDLMLYYRLEDNLRPQDVIVFEKDGRQYVGRIAARGGDSVEITDDAHLRVNNSTVVELDIFYSTPKYGDEVVYPVQLTDGQYFVLCDYREGAKDSRYFGVVNKSEIKGKVLTVIRRSGL